MGWWARCSGRCSKPCWRYWNILSAVDKLIGSSPFCTRELQVFVPLSSISLTRDQNYIIGRVGAIQNWRLGCSVLPNRDSNQAKELKAVHAETRATAWQLDIIFTITVHHARHTNLFLWSLGYVKLLLKLRNRRLLRGGQTSLTGSTSLAR